jgi:hypothetical protein
MTISMEERIHRYTLWRKMAPVDRPMIGILWEPDIPPLPAMIEQVGVGNEISPKDIHPELFLRHIEYWHQQEQQITSETIQAYTPAFGMPWVEAIAGCRLIANPGSIWAENTLNQYEDRTRIEFDPHNPWFRKMVEFTQTLVEYAKGRFPIALPQMRGPLDTLAALRTPAQMCLDFFDQPGAVQSILEEITNLWTCIAKALLEIIPPFHDGYLTRMKMWAPGKAITPQNDVSTLISPETYKEYLFHLDQRIFSAFPFSSFHMHSTEFRQVDNLLEQKDLTCIQFTLEHTCGGPPLRQMLDVCEHILEKKPLLLVAPDFESADIAIDTLPPRGLCVMVSENQYEIPPEYSSWAAKYLMDSTDRCDE